MAQLAVSIAGAVVGGTIGYFVAGPAGVAEGAEIGFALGGIAGALLIRKPGPNVGDIRVQDSAYGKPIPYARGLYRMSGNVIWAGPAQSNTSGGKGSMTSPKQTTVSMSFAVGICKGPIVGIRRIWGNGQLLYDVSNPSNFQAISGSNSMISNFTAYNGDENQTADPTMQAALGVANVPAFRGLAYVVFNQLDLSPWGNYMPSMTFEVIATDPTLSYVQSGAQSIAAQPGIVGTLGASNLRNVITSIDAAGNAYGYQWGQNGAVFNYLPFTLSPYGVTFQTGQVFSSAGVLDQPQWGVQNYDAPGGMTGTGVWHEFGTGNTIATGLSIYYALVGNSIVKSGGMFAAHTHSANNANPIQVSRGGVTTTGNTSGVFNILGITGAYIYASGDPAHDPTYGGWLVQFDLNGNFVAKLAYNPNANTGWAIGYCVSDEELYIYGSDFVYLWNGATLEATPIPAGNTAISFFRVQSGSIYCGFVNQVTAFAATVPAFDGGPTPVGEMISSVCEVAGLTPAQIDVSSIPDVSNGYAITNHSTTRGNLTPLLSAYFIDACDSDGKLRFVRRGSQPVGAFQYADLGASSQVGDDQNNTPITVTIAQEIDLPRSIALTYSALNQDYNAGTQRAVKASTNSNRDLTMQAPIVMADDEALLRVQAMLWAAWVGRKTYAFSTGLAYLQYEPGDVMTLYGPTGTPHTIRVTRCTYDGQGCLLWEAQGEEPDIYPNPLTYTVQGGAPLGFSPQSIAYNGPTALAVLDIPPLRSQDTSQGLYLGACGLASSWQGATVQISRDGNSYTNLEAIQNASVIGFATTALPDFFGGNIPDELSTVTVTLYNGALSSVSYANFLAANSAAVIGNEVIFFRTATQTAANTYTLSGLLRGRLGTGWATSSHVAGDQFVYLDPNAISRVGLNLLDIGQPLYFETFLNNSLNPQASAPVSLTPKCANVRPLKPHLFTAVSGSSASPLDISLAWFRSARVNTQWVDGADVPLDESVETYQLQIINTGGVVVRTATITAAQAYVYSAANIAADGFTTGNTINFSLSQNSNQGVLGLAATASITR